MKAYKYKIPVGEKVEIEGEFKEPGLLFGYRIIIAKKKDKNLERYYDGEIKVPDNYFSAQASKTYTEEDAKTYTEEELRAMKYKELQKIAKGRGLKYKVKKEEMIKNILASQ